MTSRLILPKHGDDFSRLVGAPDGGQRIDTTVHGLYRQHVRIRFPTVTIDSDTLDCAFTVPFDDNTEANEAEITLYNLSYNTTNQLTYGSSVTIEAGYGEDLGVIFSGTLSDKKIQDDDTDRVITIRAMDGAGLAVCEVDVEYAEGNTAQAILYDLCTRLGFPIAFWAPVRDCVYDRSVHVDGSLMDAVEKYAGICGVSAYVCKGLLYVREFSNSGGDTVPLSVDTGLLTAEEYEKEQKNGNFTDTIRGWKLEMLLNHRIQTGTRIDLTSRRANGSYYVKEGEHRYDGGEMRTTVTAVER